MLKKAISERGKSTTPLSTSEALNLYGFTDINEAAQFFSKGLGREWNSKLNISASKEDTLQYLTHLLITNNNSPISKSLPNIVFILSESWSAYLAECCTNKEILMPEMWKHIQQDFWWKNFTSVRNGTERTLSTIMAAAPYKGFCLSTQAVQLVPTSIATYFKQNGYDTTFVTGMNAGWSNLNNVIPAQNFDSFISKYEMLKEHPEYKFCDVGVFDQYMFETIIELLSSSNQPQFILGLTTTNHPPLQLPNDVTLPVLPDTLLQSKQFQDGGEKLVSYLKGFQYANLCIGQFLNTLKNSPLAENTIVVITGDHNVRSIINYNFVQSDWQHRVPLYMYIPKNYLKLDTIDTERYADHYDILPTLAHICLTGNILNIGRDLLSLDTQSIQCAYNEDDILCIKENKDKAIRFTAAREALLNILFYMLL